MKIPCRFLCPLIAGILVAMAIRAGGQATPAGVPFLHGFDVSINGSEPLHFGLDTGAATDFFIVPANAQLLGCL
jgi:hypothetical protein